mmetsp:Transcript_1678/g.2006  ORF Transcript_1678/g.2006 Transcript_1678/m.2006 type:complete len:367 (-) Transcript_1678:414-1514(-)
MRHTHCELLNVGWHSCCHWTCTRDLVARSKLSVLVASPARQTVRRGLGAGMATSCSDKRCYDTSDLHWRCLASGAAKAELTLAVVSPAPNTVAVVQKTGVRTSCSDCNVHRKPALIETKGHLGWHILVLLELSNTQLSELVITPAEHLVLVVNHTAMSPSGRKLGSWTDARYLEWLGTRLVASVAKLALLVEAPAVQLLRLSDGARMILAELCNRGRWLVDTPNVLLVQTTSGCLGAELLSQLKVCTKPRVHCLAECYGLGVGCGQVTFLARTSGPCPWTFSTVLVPVPVHLVGSTASYTVLLALVHNLRQGFTLLPVSTTRYCSFVNDCSSGEWRSQQGNNQSRVDELHGNVCDSSGQSEMPWLY